MRLFLTCACSLAKCNSAHFRQSALMFRTQLRTNRTERHGMAKRRRSCTVMQRHSCVATAAVQRCTASYIVLRWLQPFFHGRFNDFRAGLLTASVWTACAPVAHICAGTGLTPATSAPGLIFQGSLRLSARERNRSACVLGSSAQVRVLQSSVDRHTVGLGAGVPPQVGTPLAPAPRQGSPLPHMHEIWAHPCHAEVGCRCTTQGEDGGEPIT